MGDVSKEHSHVARNKLWPPFSTGRSPVETDTGEFSVSGRRIGLNHDLRNVNLPLGRSVE